ncbi:DUF6243 family protein [Streptomyces qinzhouensis]|uniref:Uncharacterized protein n=1 Tax=Streptomyces qinzhouensis TaxID=2599401 RepID=A0A5B8J5S7_9ACTN|nr:DUF6243 family protein [Streptomyces qinzhouensis]QDY76647.1 hypothetical protein FQU76_09010 [Streptomyces qinzhouensis]
MAKSRNNLLGVGGQRRKPARPGQQGAGPVGVSDRKAAADQKTELLNRMRARTQEVGGTEGGAADQGAPETGGQDG